MENAAVVLGGGRAYHQTVEPSPQTVERLLKLSREQFEQMALEQLDTLYRVARRFAHDAATAEDLVQETYVRAIQAWQSFNLRDCGIRPWLIRVMHNLHVNRSQRASRQPQAIEQDHLESLSLAPNECSSSDPSGFEMMDERLVGAVRQLPREYQTVLLLWAVEDFSYKEIAVALDVPVGTVMSRLHRAREKLSAQLRGFAQKEGIIRE